MSPRAIASTPSQRKRLSSTASVASVASPPSYENQLSTASTASASASSSSFTAAARATPSPSARGGAPQCRASLLPPPSERRLSSSVSTSTSMSTGLSLSTYLFAIQRERGRAHRESESEHVEGPERGAAPGVHGEPHDDDAEHAYILRLPACTSTRTPSRVAWALLIMLADIDSLHHLITVYNPESRVTPHSLLAWLAQCDDLFQIFNSRNANNPLAIVDQIRIMGHAMQEPSMQQWWMQGRDKYLKMGMDDWTKAIKERWLSTSGVNDAARICYGLKQGHKDFNTYATELAYHRNIVGDIIIPEITYKNLLLFGAHPVLMYDVLAIPKFDASAPDLTSSELQSIMSARWDAIVSTDRHNPVGSWFSKPTMEWTAKPEQATRRPCLVWCIGFWVLELEAQVVTEVQAAMEVRVATEVQAAMEVRVATEVQAAMEVQVVMGVQEGMVGTEVQQVEMVLGAQEVREGPGLELVRVAQPVLEEGLARVAQPVLEGQVVEQVVWAEEAAQVVSVVREAWEQQQTPSFDCFWHSERRAHFHETSGLVAQKAKQHETGQTTAVCAEQLQAVVDVVGESDWSNIVIAYEFVWAIGKVATSTQVQDMHADMRAFLAKAVSPAVAAAARIIYCGSVTARSWPSGQTSTASSSAFLRSVMSPRMQAHGGRGGPKGEGYRKDVVDEEVAGGATGAR
ncbi:hypothetical protein B0H11DRAFT_2282964 [Mycena galericulata]|nr:hypothetical protein B0H11DRAFT_2282964 [Mycena galericulata]